ncbi:hypothetical protein ACKC9G_11345 [Pokkaliibacter sp. CJK22405]|uniref:hypothetical protein n=1 Tax=Pokkaliibacter sp. CJK22405 TaxID=3384615 RepID=UPI003984B5EC
MSTNTSDSSSKLKKIAVLALGYQQYEVHGCYPKGSRQPSHYRICEAGQLKHDWRDVDTFPSHRTLRRLFD